MKTLILAAFSALWLATAMNAANAGSQPYRTPPHNYYQNNWMSSVWIFQAPSAGRKRLVRFRQPSRNLCAQHPKHASPIPLKLGRPDPLDLG